MSYLLHGDCLEELKGIDDNFCDLIFLDLPYGQTACKWDCLIDLDKLWIQLMRVKKLNTPIIMTCTTKFGVSLIQSAPKKCPFRYDLVWCKSAPCGFLSAKKMPMRKHEMIYLFYEKLPFYDLSSHKHKFLKENATGRKGNCYRDGKLDEAPSSQYTPRLPTSLVTPNNVKPDDVDKEKYDTNEGSTMINGTLGGAYDSRWQKGHKGNSYDPPLPTSLIKENNNPYENGTINSKTYDIPNKSKGGMYRSPAGQYEPPLPTSLIKENNNLKPVNSNSDIYGKDLKRIHICDENGKRLKEDSVGSKYEPPLPTSLIQDEGGSDGSEDNKCIYGVTTEYHVVYSERKNGESAYNPPLPNSLLEIKSTRGKHSTEKPVALMEWILKYYSKEDDVVLDATMGSGSMGVACKNMKRNFIGIEMDEDIYNTAVDRIEN